MRWSFFVLALLSFGVVWGQGTVWTVDDDMGADFASIQSGINSPFVSDGDTLLVKTGFYDRLSITGKALTIQAEEGASVIVGTHQSGMVVRNLAPGQVVHLRGLLLEDDHTNNPGLVLDQNQGTVWVEDCTFLMTESGGALRALPAIEATDCSSVVLLRIRARGDQKRWASFLGERYGSPGPGLHVERANVHVYDCVFEGGNGASGDGGGSLPGAQRGAPGVYVDEGFLFLSASSSTGGDGAASAPFGVCYGQDGGAGIEMWGPDPQVYALGSTIVGGEGAGQSCSFGCCDFPGDDGLEVWIRDGDGDFFDLPGDGLQMDTNSPVREGDAVQLDFAGPPDVPVFLAVADEALPFAIFFPVVSGSLLVAPPLGIFPLGTTSPTGQLSASFPVTELGPGVDGDRLFAQSFYFDPVNGYILGEASMVLALDGAF